MSRLLYEIAAEIKADWAKPSPYAVEYLEALRTLRTIEDSYYYDSAESVVLYFLANASGWRGETARSVKAELRSMLKEKELAR